MDVDADGRERFFDFERTFVPPFPGGCAGTAVVVVDMQLSNTSPAHGVNRALDVVEPGSADYINERIRSITLPAIGELLSAARERSVPVVYVTLGAERRDLADMPERTAAFVRALEEASGVRDILWTGDAGYAICPEIAPEQGDLVVRKTSWGAFNSSPLDDELTSRGVRNLVVCGVTTNCCVETTARDAADRGYAVGIVEPCTADFDVAAHDAALRAFHFNFGTVFASVDEVTRTLDQPGPTTPVPQQPSSYVVERSDGRVDLGDAAGRGADRMERP